MHARWLFLTCGTVLVLQITAMECRADTCTSLLDQVKSAADRAVSDMSDAGSNSQSSVSEIRNEQQRLLSLTRSCAASGEAAGILKSYRIVIAECQGDRPSGRSDRLDDLDRSISKIRVMLDKNCR